MKEKLMKAAKNVVKTCLDIKPGENFLVITDTETKTIGEALFIAGLEAGAEAILTVMKPRTRHGEEPPEPIATMWPTVDAYVAPTKFSLTHTQARLKATEAGARGATLPGITEEIFIETLGIDYSIVKEYVEKMAKALEGAETVRITSELGTDITMSIKGRKIYLDTGILHEKGAFGNLPAGEVCLAPVEGTANGTIVFDGSVAGVGVLKEPITLKVKDGYVTEITGGEEAEKLKQLLDSVQKKEAYNIAELGIGCNPNAKIMGNVLVDEKVYKTVHIALGDNTVFGGKVAAGIHLDGIITRPTLIVDGKVIIKNGEWQI